MMSGLKLSLKKNFNLSKFHYFELFGKLIILLSLGFQVTFGQTGAWTLERMESEVEGLEETMNAEVSEWERSLTSFEYSITNREARAEELERMTEEYPTQNSHQLLALASDLRTRAFRDRILIRPLRSDIKQYHRDPVAFVERMNVATVSKLEHERSVYRRNILVFGLSLFFGSVLLLVGRIMEINASGDIASPETRRERLKRWEAQKSSNGKVLTPR